MKLLIVFIVITHVYNETGFSVTDDTAQINELKDQISKLNKKISGMNQQFTSLTNYVYDKQQKTESAISANADATDKLKTSVKTN